MAEAGHLRGSNSGFFFLGLLPIDGMLKGSEGLMSDFLVLDGLPYWADETHLPMPLVVLGYILLVAGISPDLTL